MLPLSFGAQRGNVVLLCLRWCYGSINLSFGPQRISHYWFRTQFYYQRSCGELSTAYVTFVSNDWRQTGAQHLKGVFRAFDGFFRYMRGSPNITWSILWSGINNISQNSSVKSISFKNFCADVFKKMYYQGPAWVLWDLETNWLLTSADFTHASKELWHPIKSLEIQITIDVLGFVILAPNITNMVDQKKSILCSAFRWYFLKNLYYPDLVPTIQISSRGFGAHHYNDGVES